MDRSRPFCLSLLLAIGALSSVLPAPAAGSAPQGGTAHAAVPVADGDNSTPGLNVYVMNADGTNITRLTDHGDAGEPAWSPDGRRIAFVRRDAGHYNISVMAADGSNPVNLTRYAGCEFRPNWAPDGQRLVFARSDGTAASVFVMGADGSNPKPVTNGSRDGHPAWSPDGGRIAFDRAEGSADPGLYVAGADGSNVVRLTENGSQSAWSPDGRRIAFVRHDNGNHIYVMAADGSNAVLVTREGLSPVWSPDGSLIAFTSLQNLGNGQGGTGIFVVAPDGSGRKQIGERGRVAADPSWSPDGTRLAFESIESGSQPSQKAASQTALPSSPGEARQPRFHAESLCPD
jgi:TolB protein